MGAQSALLLTPDRRRALDILLCGGDHAAAADAAGVTARTVRRWVNEPAFTDALKTAQDSQLDNTVAELVRASASAADLLRKIVSDPDAKTALRLRAAEVLLSACLRWKELRDVEKRLTQLESKVLDTI